MVAIDKPRIYINGKAFFIVTNETTDGLSMNYAEAEAYTHGRSISTGTVANHKKSPIHISKVRPNFGRKKH